MRGTVLRKTAIKCGRGSDFTPSLLLRRNRVLHRNSSMVWKIKNKLVLAVICLLPPYSHNVPYYWHGQIFRHSIPRVGMAKSSLRCEFAHEMYLNVTIWLSWQYTSTPLNISVHQHKLVQSACHTYTGVPFWLCQFQIKELAPLRAHCRYDIFLITCPTCCGQHLKSLLLPTKFVYICANRPVLFWRFKNLKERTH